VREKAAGRVTAKAVEPGRPDFRYPLFPMPIGLRKRLLGGWCPQWLGKHCARPPGEGGSRGGVPSHRKEPVCLGLFIQYRSSAQPSPEVAESGNKINKGHRGVHEMVAPAWAVHLAPTPSRLGGPAEMPAGTGLDFLPPPAPLPFCPVLPEAGPEAKLPLAGEVGRKSGG
jgi:hypothetical protein